MLQNMGHISQTAQYGETPSPPILLYPTILICTRTEDDYFIAELVGSRRFFKNISLKEHKAYSIDQYFYQFDIDAIDPVVEFNAAKFLQYDGIVFSHDVDLDALYRRFPFLAHSNAPQHICGSGKGATVIFRNNSNFISFQNCTIINRYSSAIRVKHLHYLDVIHRSTVPTQYQQHLEGYLKKNELYGVQSISAENEDKHLVASQFANIFLFPRLHETTIGEFFRSHPDFVRKAFYTPRFVYEPYLKWQEGNPDPKEIAINPDLFVQRPDGYYDIYDLKTALLNKKDITKGKRARRRFLDYVTEGVAQLANYAEYFEFSKNKDHAFEKYQIIVNEPRLILVVGNSENVQRKQIDEACRMLKNFELIDYDTVLHLYLNSNFPIKNVTPQLKS